LRVHRPHCSALLLQCRFIVSVRDFDAGVGDFAADPKHDGIDLTPHLQVVARDAGRHAAQMREQQAAAGQSYLESQVIVPGMKHLIILPGMPL
jgi:hypothetical protein